MERNETNKLDEILQKYRKEVIAILNEPVDKTISRDVREAYIKQAIRQQDEEAKQAIIELIEGEVIGENQDEGFFSSDFGEDTRLIFRRVNAFRDEQRQKLQKLKE